MFQKLSFLVLGFSFLIFACNQSKKTENADDEKKEEMAQFAKDEEFKNKHEKPESINFNGNGEMLAFPTSDGPQGKAYAIKSAKSSGKYLFVIHEWWGLNDQIKREAERLHDALDDVTVLALDLYDGSVTDDRDEAGKIMSAVKPERAEAIIRGALKYAGTEAKVATVGWCFGGGWSLRSSILAGGQGAGCVMYYGMPVQKADEIAPLNAEVLGIFAKSDGWINEKVIGEFSNLTKATGKKLEVHWFDADHAFANPTSPRYKEKEAQEANALVLAFLKEKLKD